MDNRRVSTLGFGWLGGCAIGCGVVTLILILAAVGLGIGANYAMEEGGREAVAELTRQMEAEREAERLPAEADEVFSEALRLLSEGPSNMMPAVMSLQFFEQFKTADAAGRADILAAMRELTGFLRSQPQAGVVQFLEFVDTSPKLKKVMDQERDHRRVSIQYKRGDSDEGGQGP